MSFNTTKKNYNKAYKIYDKIGDQFHEIEKGLGKESDFRINQLLLDLRDFRKYLNGVYVDDLKGKVDEETLDQVKHNMNLFNEAHYHIERKIKGIKYFDDIILPVTNFIEEMNLSDAEYRQWANDYDQLAQKFAATITHIDNVESYENELKRLGKGKMSKREFMKIFNILKSEMIPLPELKFQSLSDYSQEMDRQNLMNPYRTESDDAWKERIGQK